MEKIKEVAVNYITEFYGKSIENLKTIELADIFVAGVEFERMKSKRTKKLSSELFEFFIWFRENGEKHIGESIEKLINIYLKTKV
jgi:endonuclease III-like uncharacterized protein